MKTTALHLQGGFLLGSIIILLVSRAAPKMLLIWNVPGTAGGMGLTVSKSGSAYEILYARRV